MPKKEMTHFAWDIQKRNVNHLKGTGGVFFFSCYSIIFVLGDSSINLCYNVAFTMVTCCFNLTFFVCSSADTSSTLEKSGQFS